MIAANQITQTNLEMIFPETKTISVLYKVKINNQISCKTYTKERLKKLVNTLINFPNLDIEIVEVIS